MNPNLQSGVPSPPHVRMVDGDGNPELSWYTFFVALWNRTGGASGSASAILDQITSAIGAMLFRGSGGWQGLSIGNQNEVLQVSGTTPATPKWGFLSGSNFPVQAQGLFLASPLVTSGEPSFRVIGPTDLAGAKGQFPATNTNDSANPGNVGEYVSNQVLPGAAIGLTTGTAKDITSITLTPGDWDVWGNVGLNAAVTSASAWVGSASVTDPGAPNSGAYLILPSQAGPTLYPIGNKRRSISAATTVYLSVNAAFSGSVSGYGFIGARRVR